MQRVSDVGVAAGEAWRSLTLEQKAIYEEQSVASKVRLSACTMTCYYPDFLSSHMYGLTWYQLIVPGNNKWHATD